MSINEFEMLLSIVMTESAYDLLMKQWQAANTEIHYAYDYPPAHMVYYITTDSYNDYEPDGYTIRWASYDGSLGTLSEYKQYESLIAAIEALSMYIPLR